MIYPAPEPVPESELTREEWMWVCERLEQRAAQFADTDPATAELDRISAARIRAQYAPERVN